MNSPNRTIRHGAIIAGSFADCFFFHDDQLHGSPGHRLFEGLRFCAPVSQGGFGWTDHGLRQFNRVFHRILRGHDALCRLGRLTESERKSASRFRSSLWSHFWHCQCLCRQSRRGAHFAIRSVFAVGEAGNFPASIKTVAEWFPKRERALATAIFNAGSNVRRDDRRVFCAVVHHSFRHKSRLENGVYASRARRVSLADFLVLALQPAEQSKNDCHKREYNYIHIDDETAAINTGDKAQKVSWLKLFRYRQLWAFFAGKFMTDGIWWFYLVLAAGLSVQTISHDSKTSHAADIHRLWRRHRRQYFWRRACRCFSSNAAGRFIRRA